MQRSSRQKTIIGALGRRPVSVTALARLTGASEVTIRRDLSDLEGHGLVRRVHGGAVATELRGTPLPYSLRAAENAEGKRAIAEAVSSLVEDDMSLVIDNGSTMVAVAGALAGRRVTALCVSLRAAVIVGDAGGAVVTPGGMISAESLRYGGAACLEALDGFRADLAVVGTCSAQPATGLTVTTSEDALVKRAIIAASARVVLAATGDKLLRTSAFRFGTHEDVDDLVTTADAPVSVLEAFESAGARVHIAR